MESTPAAVLDDTVVALDAVLQSGAMGALDAGEMMDLLRVVGEIQRRAEAVVVEAVASVDQRPDRSGEPAFCGRYGCRSMNELLQRVLRTDAAGAARLVKGARLVRRDVDLSSGEWLPARWPALREALLDGAIGVTGLLAATGPIEQAGPRVRVADRWEADAYLAGVARGAESDDGAENEPGPAPTPEDLRVQAQLIVQYLDPDGAEPAEDIALRARGVVLGRAKDGVIPVRGALLPEVAGQLQRIWDAYLNPRVDGPPLPGVHFVPSAELEDSDAGSPHAPVSPDDDVLPSGDPGGMIDARTRAQKQHDALAAALGIAARHDEMPRLGGAAPTLVVTVGAEDYATGRGWARVDGVDTPVSTRVAAHTACGGSIQRVVYGAGGRIVGLGSSDRIFTPAQRRAICVRDRECLIPGCHVPAAWCEIHHVTEYARGGPTHTDNGVALCWHHHRTLDTSGWQIRMRGGAPQVRGPAWWDPARRWRTPRPATGTRTDRERPARRAPASGRIVRARTSSARSATSAAGRGIRE
ncbi:HNH endonuclease signature motif containing protein [Microbacterium sp. JAI119]|uniref:HNH endonuclease signature motif containing protein n=1 Tax=Microbacterium sp. JAI119 TaxID=2723062 RepID=UPI0015CE8345|nr:HNH endonuclease signature motif containing protein [Microbacterium sp. JAI119]NYF28795.1 hypothetical protein [Microbacterium sp. JAI119]